MWLPSIVVMRYAIRTERQQMLYLLHSLRPAIAAAKQAGHQSLPQIAAYLAQNGYRTADGGQLHPMTVKRLLGRLEAAYTHAEDTETMINEALRRGLVKAEIKTKLKLRKGP